jgi:general secretion pathway protein C
MSSNDFKTILAEKNLANKFRLLIEKILPYIVTLLFGYFAADLVILNFRDKLLPSEAPPPKFVTNSENFQQIQLAQYTSISTKNIFNFDGIIPEAVQNTTQQNDVELPPVPSTLPLTLMGTIVHSLQQKSIANIEVKSKNQVIPYMIGRDIEGIATITKIEREKVFIKNINNGRNEYLELKQAQKLSFNVAKELSAVENEVKQLAPNRFEISRADLNKYTSDLSSILQQAAMVPVKANDGSIQCFKFISIQPGSIYTQLGFQAGDCLDSVNGEKIDGPQKAMELFQQLKNSNQIKISYERDGRKQDSDYSIK